MFEEFAVAHSDPLPSGVQSAQPAAPCIPRPQSEYPNSYCTNSLSPEQRAVTDYLCCYATEQSGTDETVLAVIIFSEELKIRARIEEGSFVILTDRDHFFFKAQIEKHLS